MRMSQALDIEEFSAPWLSEIMGYEIRSFTHQKVGTGQTGASYRLTLDADRGPRTLIAKVGAGALEARKRVADGYAAEVGFYSEILDTLDVRTPKCWYAAISNDKLHFTLLLEDVAPRRPGVQVEGCSLERARGAIRNLAGLHAPRWNDASLHDMSFLINISDQQGADFIAQVTRAATAEFVDRYRGELGSEDAETLGAAADAIGAWALASPSPFTVLHGDFRLDNLMFGEDPDDVIVLDWQTAALGPPTRDLAYFLGTSLKTPLRRDWEQELVATYHQELLNRRIGGYDLESCFRDYRLGQLQAPMITTIGAIYATGERSASSDAMFLAMAKRSSAAIRDLRTFELL